MGIENYEPIIMGILVSSMMGAITTGAIKKYEFSQVLKLSNAQVAVFGVMIGAMTAHFTGADGQAVWDGLSPGRYGQVYGE